MMRQITDTDARTGDEINIAIGHTGVDGRAEFKITDLRRNSAYIEYMDHDNDGIWIQANRFARRDDFTLEVL